MKKISKIICASILTLSVVSNIVPTANAYCETKKWSSRHINVAGVPKSESKTASVVMHATAERYLSEATSMTNIQPSNVIITTKDNRKMNARDARGNNQSDTRLFKKGDEATWTISGEVGSVTYKVQAKTKAVGALDASGYIKR